MKKLFLILIALIIVLGLVGFFAWGRRSSLGAQLIQRHLGVPVTIGSLELNQQGAQISNLWIGNSTGYKSKSAFTAQSIGIATTWHELRSNPLIIDDIEMNDLVITIEINKNGQTNWNQILAHREMKSPPKRHWLIKTLTLNNLKVQVVQANGSVKQYPTLSRMQFNDISDETGFPVDQIEKAIFNQVMQNLFKQLDLQKIFDLIPGGNALPIPKLF